MYKNTIAGLAFFSCPYMQLLYTCLCQGVLCVLWVVCALLSLFVAIRQCLQGGSNRWFQAKNVQIFIVNIKQTKAM